jgi:hypothetical protein
LLARAGDARFRVRAFHHTSVVDDFASLGDLSGAHVVRKNAAQPWLCAAACLAEYVRRTPVQSSQLFVQYEHGSESAKGRARDELVRLVESFLGAHGVESHHRRR